MEQHEEVQWLNKQQTTVSEPPEYPEAVEELRKRFNVRVSGPMGKYVGFELALNVRCTGNKVDALKIVWPFVELGVVRLDGLLDDTTVDTIDTTQAVDDDGMAVYPRYRLTWDSVLDFDDFMSAEYTLDVGASDMEAFAATW